MKKAAKWMKKKLMRLKDPRYLLLNIVEFALVALAVITFTGESLMGISINHKIFWICLCIYMVYPIYKLIDHAMKTVSDIKRRFLKE